jgi:hypothetical protein
MSGAVPASASGSTETSSSLSLGSSDANPSVNELVTLSATVAVTAPTQLTGAVTFSDGGDDIPGCVDEPVDSSAEAVTVTCIATFTAPQASVAAVFTPGRDSDLLGSSSAITIPVARGHSLVAVRAARQVPLGAQASYTATVGAAPGGAADPPAPTGGVEFLDGRRVIKACADQPLVKLAATCSVIHTALGRHSVTARYLGDANYTPSISAPASQTVVPAAGTIDTTLKWTFQFTPSYTQVTGLTLNGAPYGSTVRLGCHGSGCEFAGARQSVSMPASCRGVETTSCTTASAIDLSPSFAGQSLAAGSQLTIMVVRPNYVGKYYGFTVRVGEQPEVSISCLAPGSSTPGVGCKLPAARASRTSHRG